MRVSLRRLLIAGAAATTSLLAVAACQTHEFEEVAPKTLTPVKKVEKLQGKREKPYVMLVVDRSGSMLSEASNDASKCVKIVDRQEVYDPTKPCKWKDLKEAFANAQTGFLPASRQLAHFGLTVFPGEDNACGAGKTSKTIDPSVDNVDAISAQLNDVVVPAGGTPIAPTLLDLLNNEPRLAVEEPGRPRLVMLLTDGLPNCNNAPENVRRCDECARTPASCTAPDGCRPTYGTTCDTVPFKGAACLDDNNTVASVKALKDRGVDTFVIGFGRETQMGTEGARVLNAAALAGGRARSGDVKYYQAGTREELQEVLKSIATAFQSCNFSISPPPSDPRLLQVKLIDTVDRSERELVRDRDWKFADASNASIELTGGEGVNWCQTIQNAEAERYQLQFLYVTEL